MFLNFLSSFLSLFLSFPFLFFFSCWLLVWFLDVTRVWCIMVIYLTIFFNKTDLNLTSSNLFDNYITWKKYSVILFIILLTWSFSESDFFFLSNPNIRCNPFISRRIFFGIHHAWDYLFKIYAQAGKEYFQFWPIDFITTCYVVEFKND